MINLTITNCRPKCIIYNKLEFGVITSKLLENINILSPGLYFTYDHLFRSEGNIGNYEAMTTNNFWNLIEGSAEHTVNQLTEIFESDELSTINKFTIQFRRPTHNGINNNKEGQLKKGVYNSERVNFGTHPEIAGTKLVLTRSDINNPNLFRSKLFSIVYYMVKYQSFIIVKKGPGSFIFGAMLNKIFDTNHLKSLSSDGQWIINSKIVPTATLDDWDLNWNYGDEWHDLNMFIPFYMFADNSHTRNANTLRDLFNRRFGVAIENLV